MRYQKFLFESPVTQEIDKENLNGEKIDFSKASAYILKHSQKLVAEQLGLQAKYLEAKALNSLKQPTIFLSGAAGRYNLEKDLDLSKPRQKILALSGLSPDTQELLGELPLVEDLLEKIPNHLSVQKQENFSKASVRALWPLYTGGRIEAIQQYAQGRVDLQIGQMTEAQEDLQLLLVQRYFLLQLTNAVVTVRQKALKSIRGHDHVAQRMLDVGLISKAERLQGAAALARADFQLKKAKDDQRLAQRSLDSLLQSQGVLPVTGLFVNHKPLDTLMFFQQKARKHQSMFKKIEAKEKQALALKKIRDAAWKPNLSAFGSHELSDGAKNWIVGLNARWTLNSRIDRDKMQQAAEANLAQIAAVKHQAGEDIDLLVEKKWLAVSDAVARFESLIKEEKLVREVLRLKSAGFREGLNTVIEVNDAETDLSKTLTERIHVAYTYVTALAELLALTGEADNFSQYIAGATTHITDMHVN